MFMADMVHVYIIQKFMVAFS